MMLDEQGSIPGVPTLGDVVARRYRIHSVIAVSDLAVTFRATHVRSGDSVALQIARPGVCDAAAADRLLRAGNLMGELTSSHVARVLDGGLLPNGAPFLVTEWLDGCTVATLLQSGSLPLEIAVDFVLQASEALVEMHARGLVHRNLDPKKLFVVRGPDGRSCVKLLGCATAKVGPEQDVLVSGARFYGRPGYRSPDELAGQPTDGRADAWSLGVILHELLTRTLPFGDGSATEVLHAIRASSRTGVSEGDRSVPKRLDAVLDRCLQAKRRGRIRHVRSLAHALAPFGGPQAAAQLARIRAVARTASRLPKAVLGGRFGETAQHDGTSNERHSVPPTTASVRPLAEEIALPAARGRWWTTRVGAPVVVAASFLIALVVSRVSAPQHQAAAASPEVETSSSTSAFLAPESDKAEPTSQVTTTSAPVTIEASALPLVIEPPAAAPVHRVSPTRAGKRRGHPRLSSTVFPEDAPPLFNTRK